LNATEGDSPKKAGIVGFCMGGQLALYAACDRIGFCCGRKRAAAALRSHA